MLRWLRRGIGVCALLLVTVATASAQGFKPREVNLSFQESRDTTQVTASWFYTPPGNWTVSYEHWLAVDPTTEVWRDTTGTQTVTFGVERQAADIQRTFCVLIQRLEPSAKNGDPVCQTFTIPARVPYVALINEQNINTPTVVPHTPDMEASEGTIWIEFTPNDVTSTQGLFSKDHNGYGTGGHLSIELLGGEVSARIQDLASNYVISGGVVVQGELNQAALVYGPTGFQLYVNGVGVATNPYTGGTQGNVEAVRLGASAQNALPGSTTFQQPLDGTIATIEWYDGLYDYTGRWQDEVPLPPPPPVDSLVIEIANLDYGWTNDRSAYYWSAKFTPILEGETVTVFVDDVAVRSKPLWLAPIGFPVVFNSYTHNQATGITEYKGALPPGCNTDGQYGYGGNTSCSHECVVTYGPGDEWTMDNDECGFTRQQKMSYYVRATCNDPIYNTDFHEECYFDQNMSQGINIHLPVPGSNPTIRLEVYDAQGHRLGYWERQARIS